MIALQRDRGAIPARFLGDKRDSNLASLFAAVLDGSIAQKSVKDSLLSSSKWKPAKSQLSTETHGKCAFCEAPTTATNYGDVEHYRPKSKFLWYAYCYENFLLSCRLCNGAKSDKFDADNVFADPTPPWANGHAPTESEILTFAASVDPHPTKQAEFDAYIQLCLDEGIHLPNPYYEDPEQLFAWEADDLLQEVRIAPRDTSARNVSAFTAAETVIDLNRDELLKQRYYLYVLARSIIKRNARDRANGTAIHPDDQQAEDLLTASEAPFAAAIRFFAPQWRANP